MSLVTRPKGPEPRRNDPCPCKSGLKFKWCHGDPLKRAVCNRLINEKMVELIIAEKKKRGMIPYNYTCNSCGHGFDKPAQGQVSALPLCPKCESTNLKESVEDEDEEES